MKDELVDKRDDLPNPATYRVAFGETVAPYEETLLPVTKRQLVFKLADDQS
jgi:hypothetical protein